MQKEYARPQRRLSATEEASLKQSTRTSYEKAGKLKVLMVELDLSLNPNPKGK
jgi:hypothetical protein